MYTEHGYAEHVAPGETKRVRLPRNPYPIGQPAWSDTGFIHDACQYRNVDPIEVRSFGGLCHRHQTDRLELPRQTKLKALVVEWNGFRTLLARRRLRYAHIVVSRFFTA